MIFGISWIYNCVKSFENLGYYKFRSKIFVSLLLSSTCVLVLIRDLSNRRNWEKQWTIKSMYLYGLWETRKFARVQINIINILYKLYSHFTATCIFLTWQFKRTSEQNRNFIKLICTWYIIIHTTQYTIYLQVM